MRSSYPTVAPHLRPTFCTDSLADYKRLRRVSITRQARARLDCGVKDISGSLAGEINRILRIQG